MLDLDGFKLVNDDVGHLQGDQFLIHIARVLEGTLRGGDMLVRFGGDEFAMLLENCSLEQAKTVAERVRSAVAGARYVHQARTFDTTVSIGIARVSQDSDARTVMVGADRALMIAKDEGRNRVVVYQPDDQHSVRLAEASRWAARIKEALRDNRFVMHYQPVVRLASGQADHYEALLRMTAADGTLIAPGAFMHAAERFGLMPQIDRWVFENILNTISVREDLRIFVNLSGASLEDDELLGFIEKRLASSENLAGRLVFEITETVAVTDLDRAQQWMRRLMELGCQFALDDFGIAFSSFSYLRALPVSYVKIDGSFIKNLCTDTCNRAMVQALVTVAHALDKKVIAEWVENQSAAEILQQIGAEYGQGYRWGKPSSSAITGPTVAAAAAAA
jgi:diguanylate cyclase (GGDEF)-like protein